MAFTDQYFIDMDNAKKAGTQAYNDWFMANHYEDKRGYMQAASYYKELKPLPQYIQQYTERAPINKYSTLDPSSDWYNNNWDSNGPSIQPKKISITIRRLMTPWLINQRYQTYIIRLKK